MLKLLYGFSQEDDQVFVIGATNRPDALDAALRRAGRFDREVSIGIPDEQSRLRILQVLTRNMRVEGSFNYLSLARRTAGYVGADLHALCKEAAVGAVNRVFQSHKNESSSPAETAASGEDVASKANMNYCSGAGSLQSIDMDSSSDSATPSNKSVSDHLKLTDRRLTEDELEPLYIRAEDFEVALTKVQPSSKREGFATVPDVSWHDIGALRDLKAELQVSIVLPITQPEIFTRVALNVPAGVLLFGPPGCGKCLNLHEHHP